MEPRPLSRGTSGSVHEASFDKSCLSSGRPDYETPRDVDELTSPGNGWVAAVNLATSPASVRKTKPRASKLLNRHDSLKESKVLLVTDMRRSDSVIEPELFQYHNHFEFLGMIGATKLSEVFRVRHRQTNEIFAVKRSRKRFRTKLQRERCLREIKAVAALPSHDNIVAQYRAWQEAGHFYIQMDYCEGGSLHDRIHAPRAAPLTDTEVWKVAAQVASGLDFLHTHNVLHLDIKPENLYRNVKAENVPGPWRIGDFGLAVAKESKDWEEGDGDYVAPELLSSRGDPTPAADVFSLGATLYECATGKKLPREEGSAQAAQIALPGRPETLKVLLQAMLLPDPATRPLAGQVAAFAELAMKEEEEYQKTPPSIRESAATPESFSFDAAAGGGVPTAPSPEFPGWGAAGENEAAAQGPLSAAEGGEASAARALRWVPSLSPLISEGALTPGAAAGLMGLTPPTAGSNPAGSGGQGGTDATTNPAGQAGGDAQRPRPPPLSLPPHQGMLQHPLSSSRNGGGGDSFRIRRRDLTSPSSDLLGSASESEAYSFSCDTNGSASDLDFPDALSPGSARGGPRGGILSKRSHALLHGPLAKELQTSPEFASVATGNDSPLPGIVSRSLESSPSGSGAVSARSYGSIPRFPTLETLVGGQGDCGTSGTTAKALIRVPALGGPQGRSPFESSPGNGDGNVPSTNPNNKSKQKSTTTTRNGPSGIGARVPPLVLPTGNGTLRRKRQHSSRRALVHALREGGNDLLASSRSVDMCTSRSLEQLMPMKKEARHAGDFHLPLDTYAAADEEAASMSGPSTQRSARGPPSGRLGLQTAGGVVPPPGSICGEGMCSAAAAAAAAHMTNMTLSDSGENKLI